VTATPDAGSGALGITCDISVSGTHEQVAHELRKAADKVLAEAARRAAPAPKSREQERTEMAAREPHTSESRERWFAEIRNGAHFINLSVRHNGMDHDFAADWLKHWTPPDRAKAVDERRAAPAGDSTPWRAVQRMLADDSITRGNLNIIDDFVAEQIRREDKAAAPAAAEPDVGPPMEMTDDDLDKVKRELKRASRVSGARMSQRIGSAEPQPTPPAAAPDGEGHDDMTGGFAARKPAAALDPQAWRASAMDTPDVVPGLFAVSGEEIDAIVAALTAERAAREAAEVKRKEAEAFTDTFCSTNAKLLNQITDLRTRLGAAERERDEARAIRGGSPL
jgi:hypothetical protein